MARRRIIAGNWKMNMTPSQAVELCATLKDLVKNDAVDPRHLPVPRRFQEERYRHRHGPRSYVRYGHCFRRLLRREQAIRNEKQNKSYIARVDKDGHPLSKEAKRAVLTYKTIAQGDRYALLEINLETGRHHQIRCQLAAIGCPIKGDLKYGAKRSNPDGGISLHARRIEFIHPVSHEPISITAPVPDDNLWHALEAQVAE